MLRRRLRSGKLQRRSDRPRSPPPIPPTHAAPADADPPSRPQPPQPLPMTPAVSVILPVRDGGDWLHEAVASVLAQGFGDFELLVIDDGSTDDAIAGLPHDPRLRVLANPGRGLVAAHREMANDSVGRGHVRAPVNGRRSIAQGARCQSALWLERPAGGQRRAIFLQSRLADFLLMERR